MRVHYLQHVPFEGPGSIAPHLQARGHVLSSTLLYDKATLPATAAIDCLIVLGGPMGVHDDAQYPWLAAEKAFIREVIAQDKPVLGICLGAQLIATVLGARVYRNTHREIGWFPVHREADTAASPLASVLPQEAAVFHWHGDTFELPEGATLLASSAACRNQAFLYRERVLALQFHLETTPEGVEALISNCGAELDGSRYVQNAAALLAPGPQRFAALNALMGRMLDALAAA
jgi:GMP synthase-like glutamine amidotransferase